MGSTEHRAAQANRVADVQTQIALEDSRDRVEALDSQPFMKGVHHKVTSLATGADATIAHGLGRAPRGWSVADVVGGPNLLTRVSSDSKHIVLRNTGAVTIGFAVWVY